MNIRAWPPFPSFEPGPFSPLFPLRGRGNNRGLPPILFLLLGMTVLALTKVNEAQAAPPAWQTSSEIAESTGADVTVTLPAHAEGDILLLQVVVRDTDDTITWPAGWTQIATVDRGVIARYWWAWKRAASAADPNPLVDKSTATGDTYAAVTTYRFATTIGDPWEVKGTPNTSTAAAHVLNGITTLTADSLIVASLCGEGTAASGTTFSATAPSSLTQTLYVESTTSAPGGACTAGAGAKAAIGATGSVTATWTATVVGSGGIVLALKPTPPSSGTGSATSTIYAINNNAAGIQSINPVNSVATTVYSGAPFPLGTQATGLAQCPDGLLYFVEGSASGTLYRFNPSTPAIAPVAIGNTSLTEMVRMTCHPTTGVLYGMPPAVGTLYTINKATGATTSIALTLPGSTPPVSGGGDIAFNAAGVLYLLGTTTLDVPTTVRLWIINLGTNNVENVGAVIGLPNIATGLAFDGANPQRVLLALSTQTRLYIVDATGGTAATIGVTEAMPAVTDLSSVNVNRPTITKSFAPSSIATSDSSVLTITLGNTNPVPVTGAAFTDTYPAGLTNTATPAGATTCGGTVTAASSGGSVALADATIPASGSCTVTVNVTAAAAGSYENSIPAGGLSTSAGTNTAAATATLTVELRLGDFNAYDSSTGAGVITGFIRTRIAGATISLDIIALNPAKTAILTTFTGTVRVEVLNASDNTVAMGSNGCRTTWTVLQTLLPDPAFIEADNGRKTISFTQANSYPEARLRITFPAGAPTVTGCSTDNFAIRPNTFANLSVTDTDWQTAGPTRTLNETVFTAGTLVHKAGRPFTVRADALNAAGVPAVTTNYTGTPTATLTACPGAACTATFGSFALGTAFSAGQLNATTATYSEVGAFRLQLVDSTFAAVDAADGSTTAERNITSSTIDVGRFVPDHFAVSPNTPTFGAACPGSPGFTYVGQAFSYVTQPVITVTARNFANNPTALYAGAWARITNSTVTPATQALRYSRFDALGGGATPALDTAALPATMADPTVGAFTNGVGTLTFSSVSGLGFVRSLSTPNAPFNADIALALNVIDTDSVAFAGNPAAFGAATAGNGIAFTGGKDMRFGRLRLQNAHGSELLNLPIPMTAQSWNGTAFVTNVADNCTTLAANNIKLQNYQPAGFSVNMPQANVVVGGAFVNGVGSLRLNKPSPAARGRVDVCVDLGADPLGGTVCSATTANLSYLQGLWAPGTSHNNDSAARATFGIYKGRDEFIYLRESY